MNYKQSKSQIYGSSWILMFACFFELFWKLRSFCNSRLEIRQPVKNSDLTKKQNWCIVFVRSTAVTKFVFHSITGIDPSNPFLSSTAQWKSVFLAQPHTRWLKFGLVNQTGARSWDLYFMKVLPIGCSKLKLVNSQISIPVRHWTKTNSWKWFYNIK